MVPKPWVTHGKNVFATALRRHQTSLDRELVRSGELEFYLTFIYGICSGKCSDYNIKFCIRSARIKCDEDDLNSLWRSFMKPILSGVALISLALGLSACGGTSSPPPTTVSITGIWEGVETYPAQNGVNGQTFKVRYVITDQNGVLTGQVASCSKNGLSCDFNQNPEGPLAGTRNGNIVSLPVDGSAGTGTDSTAIKINSKTVFNGSTLTGTVSYATPGYVFNGSLTLTKQ